MKKIFTLITMAVMAMSAMAEDYKGDMTIQLGDGEPMEQESVISVTESEGKYTLSLADFSFGEMSLGDISLSDLANEATDGTVRLKGTTTVSVSLVPGTPMSLPIDYDATIDKRNVLTAALTIDVMGAFKVFVNFESATEATTYTGDLAIQLGDGTPTPQPAEIEVLKSNDIYTLTLKDFSFMGMLDFGDIQMAGMENTATEEGTLALRYEGDITLEGSLGAAFGAMPITLDATVDKADVLNATIGITVTGEGKVNVSFTSTKSSGISSVDTATEGSDEVVAIYDLQGRKVTDTNKKGIYILRKADGTATKVYKK